ncbi:hypothetical protein AX14_011839 [Amanita brunnescens Koide BX004]|nr:hypothetical protein AX14_011839 [Amanita brunnescens Koide BX004]
MQTDVYAYGCLYYAIFFDTVPFEKAHNLLIMRLVTDGMRPDRLDSPAMEDKTWNLISSCWKPNPSKRLTMEQVVKLLSA